MKHTLLSLTFALSFYFSPCALSQVEGGNKGREIIAKLLAKQLMQPVAGYNHASTVNGIIAHAQKLDKTIQRNLINSFNTSEQPSGKLNEIDLNPTVMAVENIRNAYRATNEFSEEEISEIINYMFEKLPQKKLPSTADKVVSSKEWSKVTRSQEESYSGISNVEDFYKYLDKADPAYSKYLIPGKINHSEITANYDRYKDMRQDIVDQQAVRVATLMASSVDKYGVLSIQFEHDHNHREVVGGSYAKASFKTDPAGYINAIKEAFSAPYGVKVAGVGAYQFDVHKNEDLVVTTHDVRTRGGGALIYVIADAGAETKVEILKGMSFYDIEDLASKIRQKTFNNWANEGEAINRLVGTLQKKTPQEIDNIFKKNSGSLRMVDISVKQMTPEEMLAGLPSAKEDRAVKLKSVLEILKGRLEAATNVALSGEGREVQGPELTELMNSIAFAQKELKALK